MSKEILATAVGVTAILAFMWNISNGISDLRGDIGELRGAVNANTAAIAEMRDDIGELRKETAANTAAIAEIRGILNTHIASHARIAAANAGVPLPGEEN